MGYLRGKQPESWHDLRQARSAFSGIDDDPWGNERFNRRFRLIRMFTQALSIHLASGSLIKGKAGVIRRCSANFAAQA